MLGAFLGTPVMYLLERGGPKNVLPYALCCPSPILRLRHVEKGYFRLEGLVLDNVQANEQPNWWAGCGNVSSNSWTPVLHSNQSRLFQLGCEHVKQMVDPTLIQGVPCVLHQEQS